MKPPTLTVTIGVDPDDMPEVRREATTFFHERGLEPEVQQRGDWLKFRVLIDPHFTQREAFDLATAFREAFLE